MTNVVFIGGTGRCGTNVLRKLLGSHPSVASLPFEYRLTVDPEGLVDFLLGFTACWSPYIADNKIRRLEQFLLKLGRSSLSQRLADKALTSLGLARRRITTAQYGSWQLEKHIPGYRAAVDELICELTDFSYRGHWIGSAGYSLPVINFSDRKSSEQIKAPLRRFIATCIDALAAESSATHFVEDNTWNILFASELLDLVPSARFVHIFRDPRDVVASFCKQSWAPSDLAQAITFYKSLIGVWLEKRSDLDADRVLEFRFENLITAPDETMGEVLEFAGLADKQCTEALDPDRANIGRWKREFGPSEQALLNQELGEIIAILGYDPGRSHSGLLQ